MFGSDSTTVIAPLALVFAGIGVGRSRRLFVVEIVLWNGIGAPQIHEYFACRVGATNGEDAVPFFVITQRRR